MPPVEQTVEIIFNTSTGPKDAFRIVRDVAVAFHSARCSVETLKRKKHVDEKADDTNGLGALAQA